MPMPREKGPTPLRSTHLFGVHGGEEQTMQSVSARQRATGPVHWTPHVHKACYQRSKIVFNGPRTKKRRMDGIYFLECVVKAFSMQRTM